MFRADWDDRLNYPNKRSELFRNVEGKWISGEANPTGCYSSPLREAPAAVAGALDAVATNLSNL